MMGKANPGKGYRLLEIGERIMHGDDARYTDGRWMPVTGAIGALKASYHFPIRRKVTDPQESPSPKSTTKPKEPKMNPKTLKHTIAKSQQQKEPKIAAKKPATVKPKYPAPREAIVFGINIASKATKEQVRHILDLTIETHNTTLKDLAATGTKLDRALVDLKAAKARIKELKAAK